MSIASAPISGQAHALADWVEFNVLISEFNNYRLCNLIRLSDEEQEEENPNIAEQDALNEGVLETVNEELSFRVDKLDYAYPFSFNDDQSELVILNPNEITKGGYIYLYCLIFSHVSREDVLKVDPPASNSDRDLMQICATYAAAGFVRGNAVSFGFPRPDHTGFLRALKKTYDDFGEGTVVDAMPAGAPEQEKDSSVDVIAWENSLDGAAGCKYLLGQVASGKNWDQKSIKDGSINLFHDTWFTDKPPSTPIPAMFIPFCIELQKEVTLRERLNFLTNKFGTLFYRYRLPKHAADGLLLAQNDVAGDLRIDRTDEFQKVEKYVTDFLDQLALLSR